MAAKGIFGILSLILTAGGLLLMIFILLAGAIDSKPVADWYFLQVDTSGISGAPTTSRWTYWNICSTNGTNLDVCGKVHPAFPFDPPATSNFGTTKGVPTEFIGTHTYYYLTRFMFAFMLIALFFGACSLFVGIFALCARLVSYLSGVVSFLAAFFQALNAALMTSAYVMGRNNFRKNGMTASIGKYAFGFEWAAFACFFLAMIFFCAGGRSKKDAGYGSSSGKKQGGLFGRDKSVHQETTYDNGENKEFA